MKTNAKYIKKYAHSFKTFNKLAGGAGLKYMAQEFKDIESDMRQLQREYFQSFRGNKRTIADVGTLRIISNFLKKFRSDLHEYYNLSNGIFTNFKKSITAQNKSTLVEIFGKDYMQYMDEILPGRDLASGPKYKAMMDLVGGEDRELMEKALECLSKEPVAYGEKFQEISSYFNRLFEGKGPDVGTYNWIGNYGDLFKFAQKKVPSFFDIRHLFPGEGQEVEVGEEVPLDIELKAPEKRKLEAICNLWDMFKKKMDKYVTLLDRAYAIDKGYMEIEAKRHEMLASIFDRLRALKYMTNSYIGDNESEGDFFDVTSLTFKNAFAKIDNWVYMLLNIFPSAIAEKLVKNFLKKLPRKFIPGDAPSFEAHEEKFFEGGKEYEKGERSGVEEDGANVIKEYSGPPGVLPRSYRRHTTPLGYGPRTYAEAIISLKKTAQ